VDIENERKDNVCGERLKKARNIKLWRRKDLADAFDTSEDAIVKWQQRGIPQGKLAGVAKHFGVDSSVFEDSNISDAEFEMMIRDSMAGAELKKVVFTHQGSGEGRVGRTPKFPISKSRVLLKAVVWGVEGQTISQFTLTDADYYQPVEGVKGSTLNRYMRGELPVLRVITGIDTKATDMNSNVLSRDRLKRGDFYISIHTPKNFRVTVYDINI
jgi:hypothetical protein